MSKWIYYVVGYVFITSGVMKLLIADFKATSINLGFTFPIAAHWLVALVELACGMLPIGKLYVKQAAVVLGAIMISAILITTIPICLTRGILTFAFEARRDIVMLVLLILIWKKKVS